MRYTEAGAKWVERLKTRLGIRRDAGSIPAASTTQSAVDKWAAAAAAFEEDVRKTLLAVEAAVGVDRTMPLFELLAWLDEWVPKTFAFTATMDYKALELLAFHVVPRLVRELRERDARGFAFYISGGTT